MEIDPKVLVELVKAGGSILTATIPSVVSFYLGRKFINVAQIKERYKTALNDIVYLLSVEDLHCREHKETQDKTLRQTVRTAVKTERQLSWSGKNSLSSISKKLEKVR